MIYDKQNARFIFKDLPGIFLSQYSTDQLFMQIS